MNKETHSIILDFGKSTTRSSRKVELGATASSFQKREYYARIFKDPPNAAELMNRVGLT
ncbi:hypothetical protein CPB97_006146, partial [Podila verticillata]